MTDSSGLSRRRFLQATGGAAGVAALAGCLGLGGDDGNDGGNDSDGNGNGNGTGNGGGDGNESTPEPQSGGTFRMINSTMTTFDPVAAGDEASGYVVTQIHDALMNYPNGDTSVENLLASNVERSDDDTTYTFTLNDATFHDGNTVTAQDFVYSFERLARSPKSVRSYFILDSLGIAHETDGDGNYVAESLNVSAEDEKTLKITLAEPFHMTLQMLAYSSFAVIPQDAIGIDIDAERTGSGEEAEDAPEYTEFATSSPIGCGPFSFDFWEKGTAAEVSKYDDYYGESAYLDKVHWQVIEDDNAMFNYAMSQNVDRFNVPTPRYDRSKVKNTSKDDQGRTVGEYGPFQANGETVDYLKVPEVSTFYIAFNTQEVPKPVRQAFAHAINQESLSSRVFKDRQAPAYHLTPPLVFPGENPAENYDSHVQENYPYGIGESQVPEAKQVMEDAGYSSNEKFELTLTHYESTTWNEMAQIIRQQLQSAHIDMTIESAEFSTLLDRGQNGNLQAYTLGWIADWPAGDNFLQLINPPNTYTGETGVLTYTNWGRDEATEASQSAAEAWETIQANPGPGDDAEQARADAYLKMEEANWEDVILVNMFHGATERFKYKYMHMPAFGAMGESRQKFTSFWKEQESRRTVTATPQTPANGSGE
ncbi:ABC transporter substrate-binding protein [Halomarina rubra]|uniref:ABC transporter substrate-binding protein n=1 Tax=Halomarina rubra TaxID=2071873 RepID=A0ABD6AUE0_9EURY|nr:ABC transporter substrate-binding protein [Halomarina rubra]